MYEGLDTVVIQDELAIEDELPFLWRASKLPLQGSLQSHYSESNARLLQVCMALDEQSPTEKKSEEVPQSAELARLDMKMNLLLDLVGRLLNQNQPRPVATVVRFNSRGALWRPGSGNPAVQTGETGVFEIYLHECLIDPLRLTGRAHRATADVVELRFDRAPEAVANLIDKLTFRRHRRRVADSRKR